MINTYYAVFSPNNKKLLAGTTVYDAMAIAENELSEIVITADTGIVPVGKNESFYLVGITKGGKEIELDVNDATWTIEDEGILKQNYGKFYGVSSGITLLTAEYQGFETTVSVVVTNPFKDVSPTHPNYQAVHFMRELGVINGYSDQTFKPNTAIPRHHIAAMITRWLWQTKYVPFGQ